MSPSEQQESYDSSEVDVQGSVVQNWIGHNVTVDFQGKTYAGKLNGVKVVTVGTHKGTKLTLDSGNVIPYTDDTVVTLVV